MLFRRVSKEGLQVFLVSANVALLQVIPRFVTVAVYAT